MIFREYWQRFVASNEIRAGFVKSDLDVQELQVRVMDNLMWDAGVSDKYIYFPTVTQGPEGVIGAISWYREADVTPEGFFHCTMLPSGQHGAPITFQRLMDRMQTTHLCCAAVYLEDMVIHSEDLKPHLPKVQAV